MASQAQVQAVEVYTTNEPCMVKGMEYKGLVLASKVKSRNVFSDIGAGFKSMVGGEIKGMSKLTSELRDELLWELKEKAANIGANAVVGLRYHLSISIQQHCVLFVPGWRPTLSLRECWIWLLWALLSSSPDN